MFDRDAILAAVDIDAVATDLLGRPATGSGGLRAWPCPDPDHPAGHRTPADVTTYRTRRGEQRWGCQGCGSGGTAIDLVMKAHHVGIRQALQHLAAAAGHATAFTGQANTRLPQAEGHSRLDDRVGHLRPPTGIRATGPVPAGHGDSHSPRPPASMGRPPGPTLGPGTGSTIGLRGGVDGWVTHAEDLLWQPYGQQVRRWLTDTRGLPHDVLHTNRIGATAITTDHVLPTRRPVDGHRGSTPAAVLPVTSRGRATSAQLRLIDHAERGARYVTPQQARDGADSPTPPVALYRPAKRLHPEILVTEGIIDALSANAAGYRAAALLSPAHTGAETALYLARLDGPLVLALDPDPAGQEATGRLAHHLAARNRHPAQLTGLTTDLNEALLHANDWPRKLSGHVRHATANHPPGVGLAH